MNEIAVRLASTVPFNRVPTCLKLLVRKGVRQSIVTVRRLKKSVMARVLMTIINILDSSHRTE